MDHPTTDELNAGKHLVAGLPSDVGRIEMIVSRPIEDGREVLESALFVPGIGLSGDNYLERGNLKTPDGMAHPEAQIAMMTSAAVDLVTNADRERWPLAGDQLMVSFDLSTSNLPTGTKLAVGSAILEVSAKPHNGCAKFSKRFGLDAAKWVNSDVELRLRGINLMVVQEGTITQGDTITKLA